MTFHEHFCVVLLTSMDICVYGSLVEDMYIYGSRLSSLVLGILSIQKSIYLKLKALLTVLV